MSSQPSERIAVVATIDPANNNNNTFLTDAVDMAYWHEAMFILILGAADVATNFKLTASATSGGTYTDVSGKAITALGGSDDNKQAIINLRSDELDPALRFVKGSLTVGAGTTNINCVVALGVKPRFGPGSDDDLASVAQIVT